MHLTNYSVNKLAVDNVPNRSITGIKWLLIIIIHQLIINNFLYSTNYCRTVRQLWKYFEKCGHDSKRLMRDIVDLILKTFVR